MNNRIEKYLKESLDKYRGNVNETQQSIETLQFQKEEYLKQIENSKGEIDMAYDVFSAKPIKNQFYREQIKNFQEQVDKIDLILEEEYRKLSAYETEIKSLEECVEELMKSKSQMDEADSESDEKTEHNADTGEGKNADSHISVERSEVESLLYKCENCKSFLTMDKDRSLMELDEVMKQLRKIAGSV